MPTWPLSSFMYVWPLGANKNVSFNLEFSWNMTKSYIGNNIIIITKIGSDKPPPNMSCIRPEVPLAFWFWGFNEGSFTYYVIT